MVRQNFAAGAVYVFSLVLIEFLHVILVFNGNREQGGTGAK
jgi:hypothetical protein